MVMFWEKAGDLVNSKVYREFAKTLGYTTELDLKKAGTDISQGEVRLNSILNIQMPEEPLYTQLSFDVPQLRWTEEAKKTLEEIANKYGLNLSERERAVHGTGFELKGERIKGTRFSEVAEIYSDEIKIHKQYERGVELFEDLLRDLYRAEPSKDLTRRVLEEDKQEGEFREEAGEKYKSIGEFEADVESLMHEAEPCLKAFETKGKVEPDDYQHVSSLCEQILRITEKAKRSGFDTEGIMYSGEELKKQIGKMEFYGYVDSLLEKDTADPQEASAILHEVSIAAEKARAYGVDDGDIRAIEQTAKMAADMMTGLSFLGTFVEGMAGAVGKKPKKKKRWGLF